MMITNTWFEKAKCQRYTWKKPGDTGCYQLDYIMISQRYRNSVKNSGGYPGADADSDHNLVAMTIAIKLKKLQGRKLKKKWNLEELKSKEMLLQAAVEEQLKKACKAPEAVEERWKKIKYVTNWPRK